MLGIEMKVGPKRLYIVQKIRGFLESVHRGESFEFTKHFIYDPAIYSFRKEDTVVLQKLIDIVLNEKMYRDNVTPYSPYGGVLGEIGCWPSLLFLGVASACAFRGLVGIFATRRGAVRRHPRVQ